VTSLELPTAAPGDRGDPPRAEEGEAGSAPRRNLRRNLALGWLIAVLCVALGSTLRIHAALDDPNFDAVDARGMLKSDPGLLYYLTERIVDARGALPTDFRADPRIEHPGTTDALAKFTVGQEFVVAWGYLLCGRGMPLHVFCVWIMGIWASLAALCVFGLALELSGRIAWAALAAALYSAMPANYRTVGWILMNEDFSVPFFALHLWLLARAARIRTPGSILLASLPLGVAVSTWHATQFFLAVEAVCVFAWFQRTRRNPLSAPGAWILPATLLSFSVAVPVLRTTVFALSMPMQLVLAMWAAAAWPGKGARIVAWLVLGLACTAALAWSRYFGGGIGEFGHVFALMWEKLRHLGELPADPSELSVEVRMMWQGPFVTLDPLPGLSRVGLAALALVPAAIVVLRSAGPARADRSGQPEEREILLCALACASIPIAWLIERTILLPGLLLPIVGAVAAARFVRTRPLRGFAPALASAAVLAQAWFCVDRVEGTPIAWYSPALRGTELAALVEEIPRLVPEGEAIAADFMTSTAILAHTGHPILFQPKWETRKSRERAVELFETFYHRSPDDFRRLLTGKYRCRYLVVDRAFFGIQRSVLYIGGLRDGEPIPGTCAESFLSQDPSVLSGVPGYKLLYRSPARFRYREGKPSDFFRVYELTP
jgi:Q-cell neuroblast polarization protein